jgi:hypothetical protein
MNLVALFKLVRVLIIIGVIVALICLFIPFTTPLSADRISAAGQLAAAVAAIFGLTIASLALFAYINREEVGRLQADRAWQEKQQLDQALHQFASLIAIANTTTHGEIEKEYDRLLHPALTMLLDSLATARKSDLYRALNNIKTTAPGKPLASELLLFFEAQIRASLHEHIRGVDRSLFVYYTCLVDALSQITKDNVYDRAHIELSGRMSKFMREVAANFEKPPNPPDTKT